MVISPGRYPLGHDHGRVLLRTHRAGLAAAVGHDLTLEVAWWTAEVNVDPLGVPDAVTATLDLGSLAVLSGTGTKPLTDSDRRDILRNARKALGTDRDPQVRFASTAITPEPDGALAGTIDGTLTLAGADRPLRLTVTALGGGRCRAVGRVIQTEHGIKPYSGLMGALKLKDAVDVEIEVDLAGILGDAGGGA